MPPKAKTPATTSTLRGLWSKQTATLTAARNAGGECALLTGVSPAWVEALGADARAALVDDLQPMADACGETLCPPQALVLRCLKECELDKVRIVIVVHQSPSHLPGEADGLALSGTACTGEQAAIFGLIKKSPNAPLRTRACLQDWAQQGVLLLNSVLTTEAGVPGGHAHKGWSRVTHAIVRAASARRTPTVFCLWGKSAQDAFGPLVDATRHLVLKADEPGRAGSGYDRGGTTDDFGSFAKCQHLQVATRWLSSRPNASTVDGIVF